jgi:hypothetical protein
MRDLRDFIGRMRGELDVKAAEHDAGPPGKRASMRWTSLGGGRVAGLTVLDATDAHARAGGLAGEVTWALARM